MLRCYLDPPIESSLLLLFSGTSFFLLHSGCRQRLPRNSCRCTDFIHDIEPESTVKPRSSGDAASCRELGSAVITGEQWPKLGHQTKLFAARQLSSLRNGLLKRPRSHCRPSLPLILITMSDAATPLNALEIRLRSHAILCTVGFLIILPIGVLVPRLTRTLPYK